MKLEIKEIEDKEDFNGNPYRRIVFREPNEEDGVINPSPREKIRSLWIDSFPEAVNFVKGSLVFGKIVTRKVQPYKIGSTIRNQYTAVVLGKFSSLDELNIEVEKTFKKLNVPLYQEAPTTFGASINY